MVRSISRWSIWTLFRLSQIVGRPLASPYVAVVDHRVVGTGTLLWLPKAGYVSGMATEPESRGRGIASRILAVQQKETLRRRRDWMVLDVESENDTAIRVYRRAGYREVGKFTWFTRKGLPPTVARVSAGTRPASRAEITEVGRLLDASRAADFRTPLPATARMLSHNELLVRTGRVNCQTWIRRAAGGAPVVVRAYHNPGTRMAFYLPMTGTPTPSEEELSTSFDAATEWLRDQAPTTSLAVVQEPVGDFRAILERLGFAGVVSSTTMVRRAVP